MLKKISFFVFFLASAIPAEGIAESKQGALLEFKLHDGYVIDAPSNTVISSNASRSMKNGFKAFCYNIKGMDYRSGEWDTDGYSGQVWEIIYQGDDKFYEGSLVYSVSSVSDNAIIGSYAENRWLYSMSLNKQNKKIIYTRLGHRSNGTFFVGDCDFRFPSG